MPLRRAALAALLILLCAPPVRAAETDAPVPEPPPEGAAAGQPVSAGLESLLPRRCGLCHLDKAPPASSGRMAFSPPAAAAGANAGDADMCYSCHNGIVRDDRRSLWSGRHHPSSGRVNCGSCHTPHVKAPNTGTFMRYPKGNYGFCATCHPGYRPGDSGEHPAITTDKSRAQDCGGCHMVHRAQGDNLTRTAGIDVICGPCHGDNPSRAERGPGMATHLIGKTGPGCLGCHNVHRTAGGKMMLGVAALNGSLCRRCHEQQTSSGKGEANHPVAPGQAVCLSCHRMHNAEKTKKHHSLLAVPIAEADTICRRCHADLAGERKPGEWSHPVGVSVPDMEENLAKKLAGSGGRFAPGGRISCFTCHRSHGAQAGAPQLVISRTTLCLYCHPEQNTLRGEGARPGAHPIAVLPVKARIDDSFVRAGGVTGPRGELTCVTCHRAHRASLVLPRQDYSCLLCHPGRGSVASTPHSTARSVKAANSASSAGLCGGCHGEHGWRIEFGLTTGGSTAIEALCASCHKAVTATNHPLGVAPPLDRGSAGLPLFWEDGRRLRRGTMGCATCHDVHNAGPGGRFLRSGASGGPELCAGCHAAQTTVVGTRHDLAKTQGSTCAPCHPVHDKSAVASWPAARGGGDRAAANVARLCGNCHRSGGPAAARQVAERFHPSNASESKPEGLVGCGGCHDPHRWNPRDPDDRGGAAPGDGGTSFLVRSAAGPADLCAGCHAAQAGVAGSPHDLTWLGTAGPGVCAPCHSVHGAQPLTIAAVPSRNPSEKFAPKADHCAACHAPGRIAAGVTVGEPGHPVGVTPQRDSGPDLPLFGVDGRRQPGGRIVCATCHDAHLVAPPGGSGASTKAARSFLRMGADGHAPLCSPCHAEKALVIGTDHDLRVTAPAAANRTGQNAVTSGVCGVCHAVHGGKESWVLWNRGLGGGRDDVSRACTACHRPGNDVGARVPQRAEAHQVNFPGRGPVSRLFTITRTAASGPGSIPLFDESGAPSDKGYLSCGSCHDVHRWQSDKAGAGAGVPVEGDVSNSFLRIRSNGLERTLCADCHKGSLAEHFRSYHFPAER